MTGNERTTHSTMQVFGLGLVSAAMVVVTVVDFLLLDAEGISFIPVAGAAILFTWIVWNFDRTWARIVGIIGTLAIGLSLFFLAFGIFQPFSPLEFIVGLAFVLGFFISLISGIMALIAGRRQKTGPSPRGRAFRQGVVALMGVAAVVSVVGFFLTRTTVDPSEAGAAAVINMSDFEFEPETASISSGEKLLLTNSDAFAHDFTLEEHDIYVHFGPGSDAVVDLSAVPPGTYDYFCSLHADPATGEGMTGQITLES